MTKIELINRWKSKEGQLCLEEIHKHLIKGISLSSIVGLKKFLGRWDLRGAKLSKIQSEGKLKVGEYSFVTRTGSFQLKNTSLESIDFSFADISYSLFEKSIIKNCLFEETIAKNIKLIACEISDCIFNKSNLSDSFLNENIGKNSGSFKNVKFIETNLTECLFYFPVVERCKFINCNLIATNFDGSRMRNCEFIGKVDSSWFGGYSINAHKSIFKIFNRVDPLKYCNPMDNIDFSKATLIGVSFRNGINISKCKFPQDEYYLVINNISSTYLQAKECITREWEGEDKRIGLHMIQNVYYTKDYKNQDMNLIDKHVLIEQFGKDFANRFFNLMKNLNPQ